MRLEAEQRMHIAIPRPSTVLWGRIPFVLLGVIATLAVGAAFGNHILMVWDQPVSWLVRGDDARELFRNLTEFGSIHLALGVSTVAAALLWRRCRAFALLFPAAVLTGALVDVALKTIVGRPRPPLAAVGTAMSSFPSGHTIQAAIVFGLLPPVIYILTRRKVLFWGSALLLPAVVLAVALSRVYLGAHWPTDVIGSMLIGAVLLMGAELFVTGRHGKALCRGCPLHKQVRGSSGATS